MYQLQYFRKDGSLINVGNGLFAFVVVKESDNIQELRSFGQELPNEYQLSIFEILGDGSIKTLDIREPSQFETIEGRKEIVEQLVQAALDFGLGQDFITGFFFEARSVISDFEVNGSEVLLDLFKNSPLTELDEENEDGISPRMYAIELLNDERF